MKSKSFYRILMIVTIVVNIHVEGKRYVLRPLSADEVYKILEDADLLELIPQGRVITQGIAAMKGFALGLAKGFAGNYLISMAQSNDTQQMIISAIQGVQNMSSISLPSLPEISSLFSMPNITFNPLNWQKPGTNSSISSSSNTNSSISSSNGNTNGDIDTRMQEICYSTRSLDEREMKIHGNKRQMGRGNQGRGNQGRGNQGRGNQRRGNQERRNQGKRRRKGEILRSSSGTKRRRIGQERSVQRVNRFRRGKALFGRQAFEPSETETDTNYNESPRAALTNTPSGTTSEVYVSEPLDDRGDTLTSATSIEDDPDETTTNTDVDTITMVDDGDGTHTKTLTTTDTGTGDAFNCVVLPQNGRNLDTNRRRMEHSIDRRRWRGSAM